MPPIFPFDSQNLFELTRPELWQGEDRLVAYLQSYSFPWELVGGNLVDFIRTLVATCPPSERLQGEVGQVYWGEQASEVVVCAGAVVESGAFLSGPTWIAPGAIVRHGAYVRGGVYVGRGAVVGHTTECKGSMLLPGAKAAHFNYIGDSILGQEVNLGAGTKLANLKVNHSQIIIRDEQGHRWPTGLRKLGAIMGNRSQTGCNAVTNPGSIFLPDAFILPCEVAKGLVLKR